MTDSSRARATARRLSGYLILIEGDRDTSLDDSERLLYLRRRAQYRRGGGKAEDFDYAESLDGITLLQTFDSKLGAPQQLLKVKAIFRVALGLTFMSQRLEWVPRGIEKRVNARIHKTNPHVSVAVELYEHERKLSATSPEERVVWMLRFKKMSTEDYKVLGSSLGRVAVQALKMSLDAN
jgi:hypothetical protein